MHPEIKRFGCPTGAAHLQGQGFNELAMPALKADKRAAGLAAALDGLRAGGITSANAIARRAQCSGLCDRSGRLVDGPEGSQRDDTAGLNILHQASGTSYAMEIAVRRAR